MGFTLMLVKMQVLQLHPKKAIPGLVREWISALKISLILSI